MEKEPTNNPDTKVEQLPVVIERATVDDLETIQRLNQELCTKENRDFDETIDPGYSFNESGKDYFKSRIESADGFAVVSREGGVAVGYLVGGMVASEDYRKPGLTIAELENMYVSESMRGRGIGGKMVEQFETWCKEKNVQIVRVVASAQNAGAIHFYEKFGAKPVSLTLEKKLSTE